MNTEQKRAALEAPDGVTSFAAFDDKTNSDELKTIDTAYAHLQREQDRVALEKFVLEASNDNSHLYDFYFDVESDLITIREKAQKLVAQYNITDDESDSAT